MASLTQVTLPEEFQSEIDAQLLSQPEPQYLHAQLVKQALNADLSEDGAMMGVNGRDMVDAGADYASAERDRLILDAKPIATESFAATVDFSKRRGDVLLLNRPKFTDSSYTLADRTLTSGQTISTTGIVPGSEQVELKLRRLAGPHNGTTVVPYALENYDAQFGIHQKRRIVDTHMQRDFDKTLDTISVSLLEGASTAVYPLGMTAVDDATSAGEYPLSYEQITRVARSMDEAHLPKFSTGRRLLIVTATGKRQLIDDPQFARYAQFFRDKNPLFPGWFATCDEFDICLSETLLKTANTNSIPIHYGQAISPGALGVGMGRRPTIRASSDDNYGETLRLVWLGDMGFSLFDDRFVVSVRHTNDEG